MVAEEQAGKQKTESKKPLETREEPSAIEDVAPQGAPVSEEAGKPKDKVGKEERMAEIRKQKGKC